MGAGTLPPMAPVVPGPVMLPPEFPAVPPGGGPVIAPLAPVGLIPVDGLDPMVVESPALPWPDAPEPPPPPPLCAKAPTDEAASRSAAAESVFNLLPIVCILC